MKKIIVLLLTILLVGCQSYSLDNEKGTGSIKIFQAWSPVEGEDTLTELEKIALHDLYLDGPWGLRLTWDISDEQPYEGLSSNISLENIDEAKNRRETLKSLNPDILILCEVMYREGAYVQELDSVSSYWEKGFLPLESEFWLRNKHGELIPGYAEDDNSNGEYDVDEIRSMITDFTNPEFQKLVVSRVVSLYESGLYDGVFLDWWHESESTTGSFIEWNGCALTPEEESKARVEILRKIRADVGDDFLILVNSNTSKVPKSAEYINGILMESYKKDAYSNYDRDEIAVIEDTLIWAEKSVSEPRINCLEIWSTVNHYTNEDSVRIEDRHSKRNNEQNLFFLALSLVQSDGYYNFTDDGRLPSDDHLHSWSEYWNVDLGQPVSAKNQLYNHIPGLFIREFEKGYVVYNRSGTMQTLEFKDKLINIIANKREKSMKVPNLTGAIFLKNE